MRDCWFESGSRPYAQNHFPFENKAYFDGNFPADFISEGLDQTRGWFYTLTVLCAALFEKPAFKNCIVSGIILADDGLKMSKRLKNYPDPSLVVNKHGADALRLYLIDSPVVRAEPLRFREDGVQSVVLLSRALILSRIKKGQARAAADAARCGGAGGRVPRPQPPCWKPNSAGARLPLARAPHAAGGGDVSMWRQGSGGYAYDTV